MKKLTHLLSVLLLLAIATSVFADDAPLAMTQELKTAPSHLAAYKPALPGVSTASGTKLPPKNSVVISTTGEGTETAYLSKRFPNLISTPFTKLRVIGNAPVKKELDGSHLFLTPQTDQPFTICLSGALPTDPVISLTLIPKDIPAQTITVQVDSTQGMAQKKAKVDSYTKQILELLRTVALGKTPEGYAEGAMPNVIATQQSGGIVVVPTSRYSGSELDIYKYKVENNQETIELSETSFYQRGVRAVSILPSAVLHKGESATVFVLADKSLLDGDNNGR